MTCLIFVARTVPNRGAGAIVHLMDSFTLFTGSARNRCNCPMRNHLTSALSGGGTRRRLAASAAAALALVVPLLAAAPAHADEPESCWTDIDTGRVECFAGSLDPVEYIEAATGGEVLAVPSGEAGGRGDVGTFDVFLLATVYDFTNFGTPSMTYSTSNSAVCSTSYSFSSLGSWNDRIESIQGFNSCSVILFRDTGLVDQIFGPASSSTNIGSASNQASSLAIG